MENFGQFTHSGVDFFESSIVSGVALLGCLFLGSLYRFFKIVVDRSRASVSNSTIQLTYLVNKLFHILSIKNRGRTVR